MPVNHTESFGWRYQIVRTIGHGMMGTVYHATDRFVGQDVALKAIYNHTAVESDTPTKRATTPNTNSDSRLALTHEFRALASLRHPNVIRVKDYGFIDDNPYFSMELLEENQNLTQAARDLSTPEKLDLVKQVLQALIYIHQRGIIHRDLKPDNIQVIDGHAKILDFGIAILGDDRSENMAGTLAYMPPEVLGGQPVNVKSDLYALGMMIYELFVGEYPFQTDDVTALIQKIVYSEIPIAENIHDKRLAMFVSKLLDKDPQARFDSARDALDYCMSCGLISSEQESALVRESFLQAATFVGREEEFKELNTALDNVQNGEGSAWLIAGESGVGKTRLIDEVRIQAMVNGVQVLRGQTVQAGGTPYVLVQEPLKQLCLSTNLTEDEIPTVMPYVPEIAAYLMEQAQLLASDDDADNTSQYKTAVRKNLVTTIENIIRRQTQPMLLILEDLHWIKESISIIQHLSDVVSDLPLMIVASYRDDERPELADQLKSMQEIKLQRLTRDKIEELTSSIIGEEVADAPYLIDLVQQETEGNVFFIVEVLRVLAERVGHMNLILNNTLPVDVFSGGIHAVVQRRLEGLPEEMIALLNLAALGGKQLDVELIAACNTLDLDMERWLLQCDSAAVLESSGEIWQFAHDKIRTALIKAMSPEQKKALHQQLGTVLEQLEVNALKPRHALVAYHYEQAGELVRAIASYEKAAEHALRHYAIDNTRQYLTEIKRLELQIGRSNQAHLIEPEAVSHRHRLWGEVADAHGDLEGSRDYYERVLSYMRLGTDDDMTISKIPMRSKNDPLSQAEIDLLFAINRLTTIYLLHGDWTRAQSVISRKNALYFMLGLQDEWIETMAIEAWTYYFQGAFKRSETLFGRIFALGKQRKLALLLSFGGSGLIMNAIRRESDNAELLKRVKDLESAFAKIDEHTSNILLDGVLSFAHALLGNTSQSRHYVHLALEAIRDRREYHLYEFAGIVGLVETLLNQSTDVTLTEEYVSEIRLGTKALHIFAQVYPLARSRAWIYQARQYQIQGRLQQAISTIKLAIKEAQRGNIAFDEGIAYLTLAQFVKDKDSNYPTYLDLAIARFTEVKTPPQLAKAQAMKIKFT